MLTIISAICLGTLCVYFAHTFGQVFYGNIWYVLFFAVAVPLMFLQSRNKFFNWVRKARGRYNRVGRILALICMYLILVICTSFIPCEMLTASTLKYVKPAVDRVPLLSSPERVVVVSYGKKAASAIVIKKESGQGAKYFVQLSKRGKGWIVSNTEKIRPDHYTFPPYR